jgi:hypothetical protein
MTTMSSFINDGPQIYRVTGQKDWRLNNLPFSRILPYLCVYLTFTGVIWTIHIPRYFHE